MKCLFSMICLTAIAAALGAAFYAARLKRRGGRGEKTAAPELEYRLGSFSGLGGRDEQQDSYCICGDSDAAMGLLAAVADGMGGLQDGAAISRKVTEAFSSRFASGRTEKPEKFLKGCVLDAQRAALKHMDAVGVTGGSTLAAVLIRGGKAHFISVGDSAIYLMRGGELSKLNREHNYASRLMELAARGKVDRLEPYVNPARAALTSYIGIRRLRLIDKSAAPIALAAGDRIMICSDGVYNALEPEAIAGLLAEGAGKAAGDMEAEITARGRKDQDNFTAVIIEAVSEG